MPTLPILLLRGINQKCACHIPKRTLNFIRYPEIAGILYEVSAL